MTSLSGNLETFSAVDVLHLLTRSNATGALHVHGPGTGVVYCADGAVTVVAAHRSDGLGEVLVRAGFLDRSELAEVAVAPDAGRRLAELLVGKGTDPDRLMSFVRHQVEEAIFELGLWTTGEFAFRPDETHPLGDAVRYPIPDLLEAVETRRAAWPSLSEQLMSLDALVEQTPSLPGDEEMLSVTRSQLRLLAAADGHRTVRELARDLGEGLFQTCRTLADLIDAGLVRVSRDRPAVVTLPDATLDATSSAHVAPERRAAPEPVLAGAAPAAVNGRAAPAPPAPSNGSAPAPVNGATNGYATKGVNGHINGDVSGLNGRGTSLNNGTAVLSSSAPPMTGLPAVAFAATAGDEKPDRGLVLKLLAAVKELQVPEGGQ